jgi:hypothetical protein
LSFTGKNFVTDQENIRHRDIRGGAEDGLALFQITI